MIWSATQARPYVWIHERGRVRRLVILTLVVLGAILAVLLIILYGLEMRGGITAHFTMQPIYYGVEAECEDNDPAEMDIVASACVDGDDETGDSYDLEPGVPYHLVLADDSGWDDGTGSDRYDVSLSFDDGTTWTSARLLAASDDDVSVNCASDAEDQILAIYFSGSEERETLQIRVNDEDGEFDDNSGDLCYSLYTGDGPPGSCGYSISVDSVSGSVPADNPDGYVMAAPWTPDQSMAIEIGPPDWHIGTGTSAAVEVLDAEAYGTAIWTDLRNYSGTFCVERWADDHYMYYLDLPAIYTDYNNFSLRAADGDGDYTNNAGTVNYVQYLATDVSDEATCATQYDVGSLLEFGKIESWYQSNGTKIDNHTGLIRTRSICWRPRQVRFAMVAWIITTSRLARRMARTGWRWGLRRLRVSCRWHLAQQILFCDVEFQR